METDFGVGMARLGQSSQCIHFGTLKQLLAADFGAPLHCLALVGEMHPLEKQVNRHLRILCSVAFLLIFIAAVS